MSQLLAQLAMAIEEDGFLWHDPVSTVISVEEKLERLTNRVKNVKEQRWLQLPPSPKAKARSGRMSFGFESTPMGSDDDRRSTTLKLREMRTAAWNHKVSDVVSKRASDEEKSERRRSMGPSFRLRSVVDIPFVSFQEAAKKLEGCVPELLSESSRWQWKEKCIELVANLKSKGMLPAKLTEDEACALALYTALWEPLSDSFFYKLNQLLREGEFHGPLVEPHCSYLPMLKLMMLGLEKLPTMSGILWRGVAKDVSKEYKTNEIITWWAFSSCTDSMELLEEDMFLGSDGERTLFMLSMTCGFDVKALSFHPKQSEKLLPPGLAFRVIGQVKLGHGLIVIQLQQVDSPFCLLESVAKQSTPSVDPEKTGAIDEPSVATLEPFTIRPVLVMHVERAVGPPPTERTWRDEWAELQAENARLLDRPPVTASDAGKGGEHSIEAWISLRARSIGWKVEAGWVQSQAEAFTIISVRGSAALARALQERSDRFAACTHLVVGVLAIQAQNLTQPAPMCYFSLTGAIGLATKDHVWDALVQPDVAPGLSFVTSCIASGQATADGSNFPDDRGMLPRIETRSLSDSIHAESVDGVLFCLQHRILRILGQQVCAGGL